MIFANFLKNFENNIYGEFVKIWEFTLVMTYVIFSQKCQFRLTNENFEISRNSPELYLVGESLVLNSTDRFSRQTTCCGMNRAGIFFLSHQIFQARSFRTKTKFLSICEMIHLW